MAEKVKYIINSNYEPIRLSDVVGILNEGKPGNGMEDSETSRKISSNVTHSGDIDAMQHITCVNGPFWSPTRPIRIPLKPIRV